MKINEIITEGVKGEYDAGHAAAQHSSWRFRDVGGYDRIYHLNRIMMAAAAANGIDRGVIKDFEQESWYEKYNTAYPYTQADDNMLAAAFATVDSDYKNVAQWRQSHELPDIYNRSAVKPKPPIKLLKKGEKPEVLPDLKLDPKHEQVFQKKDRKSNSHDKTSASAQYVTTKAKSKKTKRT